jgi:hypothetical protein
MNWGNKLLLVFIAFAALIGTLVYKAMHTKFELVSKDYYKEELRYQQKIDGARNAARVSAIGLQQDSAFLTLVMPAEQQGTALTGELLFYCGSDAGKDLVVPLAVNAQGAQQISKRQLRKGSYQLKLRWQAGNEAYYAEKQVQVH